jgi:regulatory protein YycI of two-component signal transduction system YycFG
MLDGNIYYTYGNNTITENNENNIVLYVTTEHRRVIKYTQYYLANLKIQANGFYPVMGYI